MKRKKRTRTAPHKEPLEVSVVDLHRRLALDHAQVACIVRTVIGREKSAVRKGSVCVTFVSDTTIASLNARYMHEAGPTDVLAFDISDHRGSLNADIVVSVDTARAAARRYRTSVWNELALYVIHGCLHLIGYDDGTAAERAAMRTKERFYLNVTTIRS